MTEDKKALISPDTTPVGLPSRMRMRVGVVMTMIGLVIFLMGVKPAIFGIDRSPVVGFIQVLVFLVGMAILCLGGYISLTTYWKKSDRSIAADIGTRLAATGYVIVFFAALADNFGITQTYAKTHFFGPWQAVGVQVGEAVIALGFLLLIPFRHADPRSTTLTDTSQSADVN